MNLRQCPCCDYFTIPTGEAYEICAVCFWEDDYFGIEGPDLESGANHGLTIRQARANFVTFGACHPSMVKNVIRPEQRAKYAYKARAT
ncbi:CPCC family cysteine-rich protein [Ectopseudomonas alcaliphila]|uniref:CPCC family cysteine-rich protein n=1 Tax=Ectopseudomonas alcaliphila TaxID=101564 RepID=UPI0027D7BE7D|nr:MULTISPECIES: CPCC family cysteine-rich protein [Pseudomonas]